jgi:hypothetical protein
MIIRIYMIAVLCGSVAAQSSASKVWVADNGNGTYRNPILHADYSDPDVIRAGDDFYLVASSFNAAPGLPVLHSRDLVNWTIIGHALPRQPPFDVFSKPQHGNGVWAPAIRYHDGASAVELGVSVRGVRLFAIAKRARAARRQKLLGRSESIAAEVSRSIVHRDRQSHIHCAERRRTNRTDCNGP